MHYDKIRKRASQLLAATGFTCSQFETLLICFKYHWEEYYSQYTLEGKPRQRISYNRKTSQLPLAEDIYTLDRLKVSEIMNKLGVDRNAVYRGLATFERENPKEAEMMKRQGKEVAPEDYKKLLNEIASLKIELSQERLRADFYEEMVAFGKEVYGID